MLILLVILFIIDRKKTIKSVQTGFKTLLKNIPIFLVMIIFISFILSVFDDKIIFKFLGNRNGISSIVISTVLGSLAAIPGFIAFPLAGLLLDKGVTYMALATFTNTLMMVGLATFPVEQKYLGNKVAILRNIMGLIVSLIIAFVIGIFYGEVF